MTGTFCPLDLRSEARGGVPREATPSTPTIASPPERGAGGFSLQSGARVLYGLDYESMGYVSVAEHGKLFTRRSRRI